MNHSNFVHLHVHTQYSLLDGACLISDLVHLARHYKMPALAITDHGNMFGAVEFYDLCMREGIKPIIGCEVYIAPGSRFEKTSHGIQGASFHLTLLAEDEEGYKNLMKLVTIGNLEGFYYKPRIDKDVLTQHSRGLIGLSGCLKGELAHLILSGQYEQSLRAADEFKHIFGSESFYLELMDNLIPDQKKVNETLLAIGKDISLPVVSTNDIHYLARHNAKAHEALLCIQTQTTLDDPNRMKFQTDEFYFKSADEMKAIFSEIPEAIANTIQITERCNLEMNFGQVHLPHYQPPKEKTREEYLKELCKEGLIRRYNTPEETVLERLEHELNIINKAGYTSYFLIAWDFIRYAKENRIPSGPGRGSAAGSLVSYLLGITDIDPLKYGLFFERFLNPERVSLPDIDIDFCYERRGEVIEYVTQKYGKDNVAQIITFGTMAAKAVIRDVGRVMNIPYVEVDKIAKLVPGDPNITLSQAIESEPELKELYKNDPKVTQLLDTSLALEGLTRHASTHAAGVVISEKPLSNYTPLFKTSDDQITTGYAMGALEKIGLLKMDFLGLRTLTVIEETTKIINRTQGAEVNIENIPLDDKPTFELLSNAESGGVFQLESSGMRDLLKKIRPERFEDLVSLLALYRPGPIGSGMVDDFIKRRHNEVAVTYDHPWLEPILKDTYGIIVFQEQVMQIASRLAGFTMSQADLLRGAMSKKTPEVMEEQRRVFIDGCLKNNISRKIASKIFNLMEYFAGYGFNRSHSTAYALISYRTAYLKANYPVEFMTALLTSEVDNTDKIVVYIKETSRLGIKVLPPDVNESFAKFTVTDKRTIRFGLAAVKNVGQGAIDSIVQAREKYGELKSLYEFCERVDLRLVNRKVIESLIKCGAFDTLGFYRSQLMAMLDRALESAVGVQKDRLRGQLSLFDQFEEEEGFKNNFQTTPKIREWPESQLLAFEKQLLGFYITGHPLAKYEEILKTYASCSTVGLVHQFDGREVAIGGIITKVKYTTTKKKNERMAIISLEDLDGVIEVLIFPTAFQGAEGVVKLNAVVFIKGRANLREEVPKVIANEIIPIDEVPHRYTKAVHIELVTAGLETERLQALKEILTKYPGRIPVYLNLITPVGKKVHIVVDERLGVDPNGELFNELEKFLGEGTVVFRARTTG